jgi:nucleoid-associated protein YgaU
MPRSEIVPAAELTARSAAPAAVPFAAGLDSLNAVGQLDQLPLTTTSRRAVIRAYTEVYVVRHGDTLVSIAERQRIHGGWRALYRLNRNKLTNPHRIYPGQRLTL